MNKRETKRLLRDQCCRNCAYYVSHYYSEFLLQQVICNQNYCKYFQPTFILGENKTKEDIEANYDNSEMQADWNILKRLDPDSNRACNEKYIFPEI